MRKAKEIKSWHEKLGRKYEHTKKMGITLIDTTNSFVLPFFFLHARKITFGIIIIMNFVADVWGCLEVPMS